MDPEEGLPPGKPPGNQSSRQREQQDERRDRFIPRRTNPRSSNSYNRGRIGSGRVQVSSETYSQATDYDSSSNPRSRFTQQQQQQSRRGTSASNLAGSSMSSHEVAAARLTRASKRDEHPRHSSGTNFHRSAQEVQEKSHRKFDPFCYSNLRKLVTAENNIDIVHVLANSENEFDTFIQEKLRPDLFLLLMKALNKVCHSDLDESKRKILQQASFESKFIDQFMNQIVEIAEKKPASDLKELIVNILVFFETVVKYLPLTACDSLKNCIMGCYFCSESLNKSKNLNMDEEILERFKSIQSDLETLRTKNPDERILKKKSMHERMQSLPPPNDFRAISLYPTCEDVLTREKPFLRPNIIDGQYDDVDHYLDVQFRLMREDFVRPLREGIEAHNSGDKKLQKESSVRIYRGVRFIRNEEEHAKKELRRTKDVEGTLLHFDPQKKFSKIDWEHSRRFMYGSLLCFSKDQFRTLLVSTVTDRDVKNLEAGLLRVEFCQEYDENIYNSPYTMIESEVFFTPYFHVLKTLQSLSEENFPMMEYLIKGQQEDFVPRYLEEKLISYKIPICREEQQIIVLNRRTWPSADELDLDTSQFEALHAALTRELVIIQGPPGTGKTFIGLKIAQILIKNKEATGRRTPILVVCLTNHALDQFLTGILRFTDKVVRIGSQSKCDELNNYNLISLRKHSKSREYLKQHMNLRQEIGVLKHEISVYDSYINTVKSNAGIVAFDVFFEAYILPQTAIDIFKDGKFLMWLLEGDINQSRRDLLEINGIRFELLLEEFTNKIEELEGIKAHAEGTELEVINFNQNELHEIKEWIEMKLQNQETPTSNEINQWCRNLLRLNSVQKWKLYFYWLKQLEEMWLQEIRKRENQLISKNRQLSEMSLVEDLEMLKESDVVGMTTTGAARLHGMLRKLGPEIVIVEEAAEVMESHVVACLTQRCQHLILIGDHKQLRPNIAVYHLGVQYNFDISLFERMVLTRGQCVTLTVQHRMSPAIAQLITPSIYEHLQNDESVKLYPEVAGVPQRLFFIDHEFPEEMMDLDSNSKINKHETSFILALCRHLILQGYSASDITILATYRGQMFYMRKEVKKQESCKGVQVTVVDNYQGEENKIILLSLVRSNTDRHIGFLGLENRVCVALSRAKHGLYIIGNMTCLSEAAKVKPEKNIWKQMKATLQKQGNLGNALPLRCQVHPDQYFHVSSAKEFAEKAPEGGCTQLCTSMLDCGHKCDRVCHALARDHVNMKCLHVCERLCDALVHKCKKKCYESCGECVVMVNKKLPCGHEANLMCHVDATKVRCYIIVEKTFEACQHIAKVKCYVDPITGSCPLPCDNRLDCGHQCIRSCHARDDPDHLEYKCRKPCGRLNKGCSLNHECGRLCCDECVACTVKVNKKRNCGHTHHIECSANPEEVECKNRCNKTLPCNHKCKRKCSEPCGGCKEIVAKTIPSCRHEIRMECGKEASRSLCTMPCREILPCGHECTESCAKPCTTKCKVEGLKTVGVCGHLVPMFCWETSQGLSHPSSSSRCTEQCPEILQCGHLCPGTCGKCCQGRFHELCDQPCGRVLVCGHICKEPCAEMCPPCKEKCTYFCQHSKCGKKCGEPCVPCKEYCGYKCTHKKCQRRCGEPCDKDPCDEPCKKKRKCGHACVGFCGEPCPNLCRVCDKDELTEIFFGNEDSPDARYVFLPDCSHTFEAEALQTWMHMNEDMVSMKVCPRCTKDINRVPRFNAEIKQSYNDIAKVKQKTFGNVKTIEEKRKKLQAKMRALVDEANSTSSFAELLWCLQETYNSLQSKLRGRSNVFNITSIGTKETEVSILDSICSVWNKSGNLPESSKDELKQHINLLLENLESKKHRMGQQQVEDFNLEILRLQRIQQYLVFKTKSTVYPSIVPVLNQFKAIVLDLTKRFSRAKHAGVEQLFVQLKETCKNLPGLGIDEFERRQIVQALNLQKGRWFKCPNGHPYIITECGRAMQEIKCPVCGCLIGGHSHTLRSDNSPFGLMDGSQYAH